MHVATCIWIMNEELYFNFILLEFHVHALTVGSVYFHTNTITLNEASSFKHFSILITDGVATGGETIQYWIY